MDFNEFTLRLQVQNGGKSNPLVTGYVFQQREKGSDLNVGILSEFVEER
jgi:hypothetical protein